MSADEGELVQRAAAGDREAFRTLVERHYDGCLRFASLRLRDSYEAEDVVQETFVRAYRSLPRYEERGHFKAWLYHILVNRCRSAGRRLARRDDRLGEDELDGLADPSAGNGDGPLLRAELERALGTLPERMREAFLLHFVEEWSYEEMAEMTGAGVSALKMRVSRARERLREELREIHHE